MTTPTTPQQKDKGADVEREAFEAATPGYSHLKWGDGYYRSDYVRYAWQGWQAARAAAPVGTNVAADLLSVIRIVREHPEFDDATSPMAQMLDAALAGRRPALVDAIASLADGRKPTELDIALTMHSYRLAAGAPAETAKAAGWHYEVDDYDGEGYQPTINLFEPLDANNVRNVRPVYFAAPQIDTTAAPASQAVSSEADDPAAYKAWLSRKGVDPRHIDPFYAFQAGRALATNAAAQASTPATPDLREQVIGMSVSVDVSTGEHDATNRYFGKVCEAMETDGEKHGLMLLVCDAEPNFTPATPSADVVKDAARDVIAERRRQIEKEGWTPEHDDKYCHCELARAAAVYATCSHPEQLMLCGSQAWPWKSEWFKRGTYRRDLIKSGALILAEIERIDRDRARIAAMSALPSAKAKGGQDQ